jgi:hypothetical protein
MSASSGSENRKRNIIYPIRLNEYEHTLLKEKSGSMGVTLAKFMREVSLGKKLVKKERAKAMADLGRLGGLFKLAITQDQLAAYRPEFQELLMLIKSTIMKVSEEDDLESHSP